MLGSLKEVLRTADPRSLASTDVDTGQIYRLSLLKREQDCPGSVEESGPLLHSHRELLV